MPTFNLIYIIGIIKKYLWYIVGVVAATTLAAIIYTMPYFYPPQFSSSAIVYPSNPERFDNLNMFQGNEIYLYGNAKEAERIMNYASSPSIALFVIDSLDLWKAYDIDKKGPSPQFYALEEFRGNLEVKKSEGTGVEITAYDSDPERAAEIVNVIIYKVNQLSRELLNKQRREIINVYKAMLQESNGAYQSYQDTAKTIREKFNIYSYREQTEVIVEQMLQAQSRYADMKARLAVMEKQYAANDTNVVNARARLRGAEEQLKAMTNASSEISLPKFREGLDRLVFTEQNAFALVDKVMVIKNKLYALEVLQNMDFETVLVQEKPIASDKKVRPVRSIIILVSFLVSLIVSIAALIFIDLGLPHLMNKS